MPMHQNICPSCEAVLPSEQINVAQGVAYCPACGKLSPLRDVMAFQEDRQSVTDTPSGCYVWNEGANIHIQATLRSVAGALGALFISLFWNGIVSVFVMIALAGLWTNFIGPLPEGFPAPHEENGEPMSLGMTLFLCMFLTPFVTIGACMIGAFFLNIWGKIDILIDGDQGVIRTGIPLLGWKRRFNASQVTKVEIGLSSWQQNDQSKELIQIQADRTVKFGTLLNDKRREWLRSVLRKLLVTNN